MKDDNLYWGNKKIQGELLKLGIALDEKTIRNILADFRRRDKFRRKGGVGGGGGGGGRTKLSFTK